MGKMERHPLRKPRKATFKRYTPADLGVMETQQLLTPEECNDTDLFRDNWSEPILFGTLVSKQNWSLIQRQNTRLNMRNVQGDDDSSQDQDSEDQNEDGRPRNEKGDTSEDKDEQDVDLDEYSTESSDDDYVP